MTGARLFRGRPVWAAPFAVDADVLADVRAVGAGEREAREHVWVERAQVVELADGASAAIAYDAHHLGHAPIPQVRADCGVLSGAAKADARSRQG